LQLASETGCKTIAFPNISTGVYGFPKEEAARIAVETVVRFVTGNNSFRQVLLVCFDEGNFRLTKKYLNQ
ncbi:MAG TPA: macro domain-containing protein, partial [Cyclobacteriaceae bacterium]|nr:macro domain-containing protein [Cyclobacteriaceae bacterium]